MQKLMGLVRRCVEDYSMIGPGDRIAIGLSGGKDSLALLCALAGLRGFYPVPYELEAITLDMGFEDTDFSAVRELCSRLDVPYTIIKTRLKQVIFDERKEKNPCSMCSKMRRGSLSEAVLSRGCNKVALAHNFDDAVETFLMSLIFEGRLYSFQPVTYLSRKKITQLRPMIYAGERMIEDLVRRYRLPVVANPCPANGYTKRQEAKELLTGLNAKYPGLKNRIFGSMQRLPLPHWAPAELSRRPLPDDVG